jgi:hypothetical protein
LLLLLPPLQLRKCCLKLTWRAAVALLLLLQCSCALVAQAAPAMDSRPSPTQHITHIRQQLAGASSATHTLAAATAWAAVCCCSCCSSEAADIGCRPESRLPLLATPAGTAAAVTAIAADLLHTAVILHLLQLKVVRVVESCYIFLVTSWK